MPNLLLPLLISPFILYYKTEAGHLAHQVLAILQGKNLCHITALPIPLYSPVPLQLAFSHACPSPPP